MRTSMQVGWTPWLEVDDQWGGRQTQIDAYRRLYLHRIPRQIGDLPIGAGPFAGILRAFELVMHQAMKGILGILFPAAVLMRHNLEVVGAGLEDPCRFWGREISLAL